MYALAPCVHFRYDAFHCIPPQRSYRHFYSSSDVSRRTRLPVFALICMPMCVRLEQDDDVKYKGISRQKWSARWDSHVVDLKSNTTLYLGSFDAREKAARAHDVAFLKLNGPQITTPGEIDSKLNFPSSDYADLNGTLTAEQNRIWREDVASLCPSHVRSPRTTMPKGGCSLIAECSPHLHWSTNHRYRGRQRRRDHGGASTRERGRQCYEGE